MRIIYSISMLTILLLAAQLVSPGLARAQKRGPEGTPQVDDSTEYMKYTEAAAPQLRAFYGYVIGEVDDLPDNPTPEQVKKSDLRMRLLDLRLLLDLYAFAFDFPPFERFRNATDDAYEYMGSYKDIFDSQAVDPSPVDPRYLRERLNKMNAALAPFRSSSFRSDMLAFLSRPRSNIVNVDYRHQPRIWRIAGLQPNDRYDAAGNAAMLAQAALRNLRREGLLVGPNFDLSEEERIHDIRKALRSIEVMVDMFPSLTEAVGDARKPLDRVIGDFGDLNDELVAYHLADWAGRDLQPRIDGIQAEYLKCIEEVDRFISSGALEDYASRLDAAQLEHRR